MNFDAVKDLRVLVVGDAIRDRYVFVRPLGKAMKDSVISVGYDAEENYRGGVWAAAEHMRELCAVVDLMHGPCVMLSTRFVEVVGNRKLFTIHRLQNEQATEPVEIGDYDLVVVADFGYGTMTPELIAKVSREAKFLAVNAQSNSSNLGFNMVTRYRRADYVVLDEMEVRLAAQDRSSPLQDVVRSLGYRRVVVTLGSRGALGFDGEQFYSDPARASHAMDTMGAGDAFLAVSSLFAAVGFPMSELVAIGNAAAGAKVGVVGHRRPVGKGDLVESWA